MLDNQIDALKQGKCDVVFVTSNNNEMIALAESCGYHPYDFTDIGIGDKDIAHPRMYSRIKL